MPTKEELRKVLQDRLPEIIAKVNDSLAGNDVAGLQKVLERIGRGGRLPHWYEGLRNRESLPNLDGKTVGSVIEMVLVAVLETHFFASLNIPPLRINPARGVDLPDLDLGVKSPSENNCTSEPYYSAYERILGSDHDVLVLLTDYQDAKKRTPFRLQIIKNKYLKKSQIADKNLCRVAREHRDWLVKDDESRAKRVFRFLAYVNQSDWRAKRLLKMVAVLKSEGAIRLVAQRAEHEFAKTNAKNLREDKLPIAEEELAALIRVIKISPMHIGVADAVDNWVMETLKDAARAPNDDEWNRILTSPLDGMIGMSLALQWRYNFGPLFGEDEEL